MSKICFHDFDYFSRENSLVTYRNQNKHCDLTEKNPTFKIQLYSRENSLDTY